MASNTTKLKQDNAPLLQLTREPEDTLRRIYELKSHFQQKQDAKTTEDAVNELLDAVTAVSSTNVLLRAAYSTLVAILSNVQARSLSATTVNKIYKLLADPVPSQQDLQDEHALSRLKMFDLGIAKSSQKPDKHDLEAIVRNLAKACFTKVRAQSDYTKIRFDAAPSTRMQASASGSMGQFTLDQVVVSNRRVPSRKGSSASLSSRQSSRSLAASESESSDADTGKSGMQDSAAIRVEGLRVLSALAKLDTRALHSFWPLFFGPAANPSLFTLAQSDLSLAVRLQAIHTIRAFLTNSKGYLDLARESKTKLAFTPLSQTLADIGNEINVQTVKLLRICFTLIQATDMMVSALQLTSVVVTNSPYGRLSEPHLDIIVKTILLELPRVNHAACLSAIAGTLDASIDSGYRNLDTDNVSKAMQDTFDRTLSARKAGEDAIEAALWVLIASLAKPSASREEVERVEHDIIGHIVQTFSTSSATVQEACVKALAALNKQKNSQVMQTGLHSLLAQCEYLQSPSVKAQIAGLMCQNLEMMEDSMGELVQMAITLAGSSHVKDIRSQALRSLGLILQSDRIVHQTDMGRQCFASLEESVGSDVPLAVRAEAMWNLANAVDGPNVDILSYADQKRILQVVIAQISSDGASRDAEMVRTSSIRIVGALLPRLSNLDAEVKEQARSSLISTLLRGSAKTQWNAATAVTRLIEAGEVNQEIVAALLATLEGSQNIKVRTSVVHALEALANQPEHNLGELEARLEQMCCSQADQTSQDMPYDQIAKSNAMNDSIRHLLSRLQSNGQKV